MKHVIKAFDQYLVALDLKFDATIIGGGALIIMNVVNRYTKDIDCLDPNISDALKKVSIEFAKKFTQFNLTENWLNNGPISLKQNLPKNWEQRLVIIYEGESIILRTLSRTDFLKTKIFAYCDREIDLEDCLALRPSVNEIDEAVIWVLEQDISELWPERVKLMVNLLKKRLGHEK